MMRSTTTELPHIWTSYRLETQPMGHYMTNLWVSRDITKNSSKFFYEYICLNPHHDMHSISFDKLTNTMKKAMDSSAPASLAAGPSSALVLQALKLNFKHEDFPWIKFITQRDYHQFQKRR